VKLLLDTQIWLWWFLTPDRLNSHAADLIAEQRHPVYVSAATSWEIAIKVSLGKLKLPDRAEVFVLAGMAQQGMSALPVTHLHALRVADLPQLHADPFDRLLVAQAQVERAKLLTADPEILAYNVETVWAGREPPPPVRRPRRLGRPRP
jgi:PIN domain nuclease of toxin-antitoxin system